MSSYLSNKAKIIHQRGLLYFEQDQFEKAIDDFDEAIALSPDWNPPYFSKVKVLTKMKNIAEALNTLQNLSQLFAQDWRVREQIGWEYLSLNEPIKAKEEYQALLNRDENNIAAINGLAGVYFNQGHYPEAEIYFRKVIGVNPNDPVFNNNLAWALLRQDQQDKLKEAEELCQNALKLDPKYSSAIGCRGIIAFKKGNLRESESYLCTSIQVNPKDGSYTDLGALYVQMGRYEEAEEKLKKALILNYYDTQAYIELGNLYLQTEKVKEAIRLFRQAIAIDPNSEAPPNALAIALMRNQEWNEAEKGLREAIRRLDEPKRWRLHLTLAQLLTQRGDETSDPDFYEEALKEIFKAMRIKDTHPDPYFHAGIVRFKLQDYAGAYRNFQTCLKKDQHNFEAERNARRVKKVLSQSQNLNRLSLGATLLLVLLALTLLIIIWVFYFMSNKIPQTMLTVLTPLLLGLVVVALLLPRLNRLKLTGLEAELIQPKETLSSGPKGESGFGGSGMTSAISGGTVGFSSSGTAISSGPR